MLEIDIVAALAASARQGSLARIDSMTRRTISGRGNTPQSKTATSALLVALISTAIKQLSLQGRPDQALAVRRLRKK